jgi:hypothetical protein
MRPLRNLLNELVERRLWPIALLLVLALVAVPLLLAKPASSTDAGTSGAPAGSTDVPAPAASGVRAPGDTAPDGEPVVSVAQASEPDAPLRGHEKDPFRQQHASDAASVSSASSASAAGSSGGGSATSPPGGGSGGSSSGGSGGAGTGGGQAPAPKVYTYASIDVRFGHAGGYLHPHDDVPRLAPLPGPARPIIVFMGMRADHETAVFLVSTDVHAQGEGRCVPSKKLCEAIELRRGETALLDWAAPNGSVKQYELDLVDVTLHQTTSQAVARQAYARTSRVGRRLLAARAGGEAHTGAATGAPRLGRIPFRYAPQRGVLHIAPWASHRARAARAHGALPDARLSDLR